MFGWLFSPSPAVNDTTPEERFEIVMRRLDAIEKAVEELRSALSADPSLAGECECEGESEAECEGEASAESECDSDSDSVGNLSPVCSASA